VRDVKATIPLLSGHQISNGNGAFVKRMVETVAIVKTACGEHDVDDLIRHQTFSTKGRPCCYDWKSTQSRFFFYVTDN
jgi:hypothetical protein